MSGRFPGRLLPYLLLSPTILICGLFIYYPASEIFRMSLYRSLFFGARQVWVGFGNFQRLFADLSYLRSLITTVGFALFVVVVGLSVSLALALLLNQRLAGGRFFRVAIIWPYALSPAVAGTIWLFLFSPNIGVINWVLGSLTGWRPDWFSNGYLALTMILVTAVWNNLGYNVVFFLAGLQNIPSSLLEAAHVDGANGLDRLHYILLPLLSPTTFFLLIMNMTYAFFDTFGMIDVMTGGGPAGTTTLLIYRLYRDAFLNFNSGLAAAESLILFVFVVGLTLLQFRTTGKAVYYGG